MADSLVGYVVDAEGNERPTRGFTIHYAKNDAHIVPRKAREGGSMTMTLRDIPFCIGKDVRVTLTNGDVYEGHCSGYEEWADSDEEREAIFLAYEWYDEQIYVDEIESVEIRGE